MSKEEIEAVEELRASYGKYCEQQYKWKWKDGLVMSFDEWCLAMADNAKDDAKYPTFRTSPAEYLRITTGLWIQPL